MLVLSCLALVACSSTSKGRPASNGGDAGADGAGGDGADGDDADAAMSGGGEGTDQGADGGSDGPRDAGSDVDASLGEPTACPDVTPGAQAGTLGDNALDEASGIVASRINPGALWLHNDSGDRARLFALSESGDALDEVDIDGAEAVDWEDLAIGPAPKGGSYLYIGDIGDNDEKRESVQIYRVLEPRLDANGSAPSASVSATSLDVTYEDGPHDAETLLADPVSGDLFIVTKAALFPFDAEVGVYRVAASSFATGIAIAKLVANVEMGPATGGDVLPDGSGIAIRNYTGITYWPRDPDAPLANAFANASCTIPLAEVLPTQGEAFGFAADGKGYYTTAEGEGAVLWFYAFE